MGVPAILAPFLMGANGMPIGVQVIGRRGHDGDALDGLRWLWERYGEGA